MTYLGVAAALLGLLLGLMVWDRLRLAGRLGAATRGIRDHKLQLAAVAADKEALAQELGVAGRIADWRAFHDDLTALPNRALLLDRLSQALARRTGREGAVAVLVCDLDGLRVVNDTLGRMSGDAVLVEVADRLAAALRPGDTVARIGGDEFVVVAEGLFGEAEAKSGARRSSASRRSTGGCWRRPTFWPWRRRPA